MWHLDIPKTRQYDHGKVEVLAKNSLGEAYACTQLVVKNRHDDYRALLKNSPRRKEHKSIPFASKPKCLYIKNMLFVKDS